MTQHQLDPAGGVGQMPICAKCGSERILRDAHAIWNPASGLWEISAIFDAITCEACGGEAEVVWVDPKQPPIEAIRVLNDALRIHGRGNGRIVVTSGVQSRGDTFLAEALVGMHRFNAFSPENDYHGEHDFGAFDVDGEKVFFKIDYYDPTLSFGSENPANPQLTVRVLTLMLASEY